MRALPWFARLNFWIFFTVGERNAGGASVFLRDFQLRKEPLRSLLHRGFSLLLEV